MIYIFVGPLIDDGTFWGLCFAAVMLGVILVTFPAHLIPSQSTLASPIFRGIGLVLILAGAFLIIFVIEGPLAELVGLVVLFLAVLLAARGQGHDED